MAGTFPTLVPTSRSFDPGDWPVKRYTAENGTEVRILRGSSRVNATLELGYDNIPDSQAVLFLDHYRANQGTYGTWRFTGDSTAPFKGFDASTSNLEAEPWGLAWRYDGPPQVTQAKKGRSNVRISLKAVVASVAIT